EQQFNITSLRKFAPRTAVGITADGKVLLVTADAANGKNTGPSLKEMAYVMRHYGAVSAMNLDGGGSTQMVVRGRQVNGLQGQYVRPVTTSLVIRAKKPTDS